MITGMLQIPAKIIQGNTMVPLRFVSESFGAMVEWDGSNNTILINSTNPDSVQAVNDESNVLTAVEIAKQERSVVTIVCTNTDSSRLSIGSGVIVDSNGLIVTNYHVIEDNTSGVVTLSNGQEYTIEGVVRHNEDLDIAVISVDAENLPTATLGDSDSLQLGQEVMAIGSPQGLQNSVSTGVISGRRVFAGNELIQITAPITHGSSGGGLFDETGRLIGIIKSIIKGTGSIGFAIPINEVKTYTHEGVVTPLSKLSTKEVHDSVRNVAIANIRELAVDPLKFLALLKEKKSYQKIGDYEVYFCNMGVWESDDDYINVAFEMDEENFYLWVEGLYSGGYDDARLFITEIADLTKEIYPDKVFVGIGLHDYFDSHPSWIPARYVGWDSTGEQWEVFMPLVIAYKDKADENVEIFFFAEWDE